MIRHSLLAASAALLMLGIAHAKDKTFDAEIIGFECGDNCYLNVKTSAGEEISGLCEAEMCGPWFEVQAIPADMVGKTVSITAGIGQQVDGDGNVMGEMMSFKTITLKE